MIRIGIDGGHRQTSASYCKKSGSNYEANRLFVEGASENITLTQMTLTNEQIQKLRQMPDPSFEELKTLGVICYGKHMPKLSPGHGQWFIYFKKDPSHFDEIQPDCGLTTRQLMACFYFAVVNSILENNTELGLERNDRNKVQLLVGCPTTGKWTNPEPLKEYSRLIQRATGVNRVDIVPESRAAMFSSLNKDETHLGRVISAAKGVVVFDLGSSTSDCTYMWLGEKLVELSWDLGASLIERIIVKEMILEAIRENKEKTGQIFKVTASSRSETENVICNVKEAYFNKIYGDYDYVDEDFTTKLFDNNKNSLKCRFNLTEKAIENALDTPVDEKDVIRWNGRIYSGSWRKLLKEFFENAKREIVESGYPVDTIVLTGGASHMDFVKYLCAEVFCPQVDFNSIIMEDNPEFTVSNGLAWVSLSEANLGGYVSNAKEAVKKNSSVSVITLRDRIVNRLCDYLRNKIKRHADVWAESDENLSVNDLVNSLKPDLESKKTKNEIDAIVADEIKKWKERYADVTRDAVSTQLAKEYPQGIVKGLIPTKEIWRQLQENEIAKSGIVSTDALLKLVDVKRFLKFWIKAPFKVIEFLFDEIPLIKHVAIFIGKIGEFIASLFTDDDPAKPRKKSTRRSVRNQMDETFANEDKKKELFADLYTNFNNLNRNYDKELSNHLNKMFRIVMLYPDGFKDRIMK